MKLVLEILAFMAAALGVHLLALMGVDSKAGAESGGQGGEAMVSIMASSASVEVLVARWETPPEPALDVSRLAPRPVAVPDQPPARPAALPDLAVNRMAALALPSAEPLAEQPTVDLTTPKPEPAPEPEPETAEADPQPPVASPRPTARPEPKPQHAKPQQASTAVSAQTAAGRGGAAQAGTNGSAAVKTLSRGERSSLMTVWGGQIRARIERGKRFPRGARGKGRVILRITVSGDGRIAASGIARSSGTAAFDQAALQAVARAGAVPPAPKGLTDASYSFNLPMDFK